jgi:pyroglutamyl-peptidase
MKKNMVLPLSILCVVVLVVVPSFGCGAEGSSVVLVTGFGPFANYTVNPSGLIALSLNGSTIGDAVVIGVVLPVDFNESILLASQVIEQYHPSVVLSLGLNARARGIQVEKFSVNLKRYLKENGRLSFPRIIDKTGPLLRISPFPAASIARSMREANIPALPSYSAGTYVCNSLFYQELGYAQENPLLTVGFIHVPLLDSQSSQGMPLQTMIDAVTVAIQSSL